MSGLGGTGPAYLSAAAREPAITNARTMVQRIVNLFSRVLRAVAGIAPGGADGGSELVGILSLIKHRRVTGRVGREQHQALASGAIEAHLLAISGPKPAGFVMRIGEAVGAERRAPLGVAIQIHDADIGDVHRV